MRRIEDRSANLHFIAKQLTYGAEDSEPGERKPEDESTSLNRILAIGNQLRSYSGIINPVSHVVSSA